MSDPLPALRSADINFGRLQTNKTGIHGACRQLTSGLLKIPSWACRFRQRWICPQVLQCIRWSYFEWDLYETSLRAGEKQLQLAAGSQRAPAVAWSVRRQAS